MKKKLFALLLLAGCQKENHVVTPVAPSPISGVWKFVSFTEGNYQETNADPCKADNTLEFQVSDSIAYTDQGACLDRPWSEKRKSVGRWSVKGKTLAMGTNLDIEIFVLNDSALHFGKKTGAEIYEYRYKK